MVSSLKSNFDHRFLLLLPCTVGLVTLLIARLEEIYIIISKAKTFLSIALSNVLSL